MTKQLFDGSGIRTRGGIRSLRLVSVCDCESVEVRDGYVSAVTLRERAEWFSFGFTEDSAEYTETASKKDGSLLYTHKLIFRFGSRSAEATDAAARIAIIARYGAIAILETEAGGAIVAGYSELLGLEQPLRVTKAECSTTKAPHEIPYFELTLSSVDAAPSLCADDNFKSRL